MANYKRKKSGKLKGNQPKGGWWSRMTHKRWVKEHEDKKNRDKRPTA